MGRKQYEAKPLRTEFTQFRLTGELQRPGGVVPQQLKCRDHVPRVELLDILRGEGFEGDDLGGSVIQGVFSTAT